MKTLIQIQDQALSKLNVSRSSDRRYLNLKGSVHRWYIAEIAKLGFVGNDAHGHSIPEATWCDVFDMAVLHGYCDPEEAR